MIFKKLEITGKEYKKKIIVLSVILIFICGLIGLYSYGKAKAISAIPANGKINILVTLNKITLDHNNSVGNEWSFKGTVNGQEIKKGSTIEITLNTSDTINLNAEATESDKYPDVGNGSKQLKVQELDLSIKNTIPVEVIVTENKGRYKGNTAKWIFTFSIKRKITLGEIINNI